MTTASICCSLTWGCWVSVGMVSSFRCFTWLAVPAVLRTAAPPWRVRQELIGGVTQAAGVVDAGQAADLAGFVELDAGVATAHRGGARGPADHSQPPPWELAGDA